MEAYDTANYWLMFSILFSVFIIIFFKLTLFLIILLPHELQFLNSDYTIKN